MLAESADAQFPHCSGPKDGETGISCDKRSWSEAPVGSPSGMSLSEAVCGVKQNFRNPGLIELEMFVWGLLELQPWRPRSKMHLNCHPQATKQGRLIMAENLQDYINRLSRIRTGAGKK